ncbi:myb/SANT-like DNA-binding domain-containing protein 4 [Ischnura elegans]|uniref:myb/SANT-like DNA-binding domain-containing protein 4 n=1 Tax=Ischnura elegans TaxID=197161 RepID=UPI001ED8BEE7|nr:myb/SANT-like DNA-binding domain-containing protein 4 [Ischnura elegans]
MLQFMEQHPGLARGRLLGPAGRARANELWEEMATVLNSCGNGPMRPAHKWQKVWQDWKCNIKKKYIRIKAHRSATGSGSPLTSELNPLEERLIFFLTPEGVQGDANLVEAGPPPREEEIDRGDEVEVTEVPDPVDDEADYGGVEAEAVTRRGQGRKLVASFVGVEEKRLDLERRKLEVDERKLQVEERKLELEERKLEVKVKKQKSFERIVQLLESGLELLEEHLQK